MSSVSELLIAFLTELQHGRVLELALSTGEVEENSDMPMAYSEKTVPRRFQACDASKRRKYLQLFSLAALVTELMASKSSLHFIVPHTVINSRHMSFIFQCMHSHQARKPFY